MHHVANCRTSVTPDSISSIHVDGLVEPPSAATAGAMRARARRTRPARAARSRGSASSSPASSSCAHQRPREVRVANRLGQVDDRVVRRRHRTEPEVAEHEDVLRRGRGASARRRRRSRARHSTPGAAPIPTRPAPAGRDDEPSGITKRSVYGTSATIAPRSAQDRCRWRPPAWRRWPMKARSCTRTPTRSTHLSSNATIRRSAAVP